MMSFFSPKETYKFDLNDSDILGAISGTNQIGSPMRLRQKQQEFRTQADEFASHHKYSEAQELEDKARALDNELKEVKKNWELIQHARKKLEVGLTQAKANREFGLQGVIMGHQLSLNARLVEHDARVKEREDSQKALELNVKKSTT